MGIIFHLSIKCRGGEYLPCRTVVGIKYLAHTWYSANEPTELIPGMMH